MRHSYQALSMDMSVPTDYRNHSLVPGSRRGGLAAQTSTENLNNKHEVCVSRGLAGLAFKHIPLKQRIRFLAFQNYWRTYDTARFIFTFLFPYAHNGGEQKGSTKTPAIEMEMRIWYCKLQTASVRRRYACALVCVSYFFKCQALVASPLL